MDPTLTAWLALVGGLVVLLLLDLFVLHRGTHEVSMRDAAWSTAGFIAISVVFGILLGVLEGSTVAGEFFAGYLLEKSLSLDNVFVWALIFSAFSIPPAYQHRVLFYGIFGALVLRGAFVAAGAQLLERFEWVVYVFGALLLFSGVRILRGQREIDPATRWCGCSGVGYRRPKACGALTCSSARATFQRPSSPIVRRCAAVGMRRRCSPSSP